jgi:hypothetical protein
MPKFSPFIATVAASACVSSRSFSDHGGHRRDSAAPPVKLVLPANTILMSSLCDAHSYRAQLAAKPRRQFQTVPPHTLGTSKARYFGTSQPTFNSRFLELRPQTDWTIRPTMSCYE